MGITARTVNRVSSYEQQAGAIRVDTMHKVVIILWCGKLRKKPLLVSLHLSAKAAFAVPGMAGASRPGLGGPHGIGDS